MSISRRKFNRIAVLGGASFATTSGIFFPKPAEAYSLDFPLRELSAGKVYNDLRRYSGASSIPGVLSPILGGSTNVSSRIEPKATSAIRSADQALVRRDFLNNRTELATAGYGATISLLWGRQRQDKEGPNVGFGFVQKYQDSFTEDKISGPTMAGIDNAQKILADQRLSPAEIAGSLLPIRSRVDDWGSWAGDTFPGTNNPKISFTQYETALGTVTVKYELVKPGPGGFGTILLIVEAANYPRRTISITAIFE